MIQELYKICEALEERFPHNRDPFRILARLMEESGELADQVHLREAVGRKRDNGRQPDDMELAKELQDIMTAVLDIARYYGIEEKLEVQVNRGYERAVSEGLIEPLKKK
jgi:NTP pyrophosphatase (non-canonical NTP hydrolase)